MTTQAETLLKELAEKWPHETHLEPVIAHVGPVSNASGPMAITIPLCNHDCKACELRALIPRIVELLNAEVGRATLKEAEWWHKGHICENSRLCKSCLRLRTMRAALAARGDKKESSK